MTQHYDKPDADICKVWACPTGWAHLTNDPVSRWRFLEPSGSWFYRREEDLPPGPWRPCFLVGDEPCEVNEVSSRACEKGTKGCDVEHDESNVGCIPPFAQRCEIPGCGEDAKRERSGLRICDRHDWHELSTYRALRDKAEDDTDSEPRLTEHERAVLEAAKAYREAYFEGGDEHVLTTLVDLRWSVDALLASEETRSVTPLFVKTVDGKPLSKKAAKDLSEYLQQQYNIKEEEEEDIDVAKIIYEADPNLLLNVLYSCAERLEALLKDKDIKKCT